MYPFVQNNAGKKKLFHPELSSGQRGLTFRWSNMLGIGRLLALLCCSLCVRASLSLSLSVWCVWAFAFVVTLFDVGLLWSLTFFCCEVPYIRGKFLEAFESPFSRFRLLSCIFLVSL
jgi:hypothetical protein